MQLVLTTGFLICCTCHFQRGSLCLFGGFFCRCFQCLISTLTREGEVGHLFRLTCSVMLWGGRNTANKYHCHVWGVHTVSGSHWVCPYSRVCAFPVYTAQAPGCCAGELSGACPGLHVLPRSTLLRFRFSGTPQRQTQLDLHFVPFPGPSSSGDQMLGERTLPRCGVSHRLPGPSCSVSWVVCLFWGADLWLPLS